LLSEYVVRVQYIHHKSIRLYPIISLAKGNHVLVKYDFDALLNPTLEADNDNQYSTKQ
jgi:hypothetical protein